MLEPENTKWYMINVRWHYSCFLFSFDFVVLNWQDIQEACMIASMISYYIAEIKRPCKTYSIIC